MKPARTALAGHWLVGNRTIGRRIHLAQALGGPLRPFSPAHLEGAVGVVGWGRKSNTAGPRECASKAGLPFTVVEDGFIRSIGLGVLGAEPFGFVADGSGIFYDATGPSDLESLIAADGAPDPKAPALRARLVALRACKYNQCWAPPVLAPRRQHRLLLVDQTRGDLSVQLGGGSAEAFQRMLAAARAEAAGSEILVKVHPDVLAGKRRGYLAELDLAGCTVLARDSNPIELCLAVDEVWTVTSQLGFEALLAERPVRCFGMPFYAGWGLTRDEQTCPRRGVARTLDQVFWAAYGIYTRYADPVTGERCDLARILERLADHRRTAVVEGGRVWCFGFRWRKRRFTGTWLPGSDVRFVRSQASAKRKGARPGDRVLTWGFRADAEACALAAELGATVERMEDGFVRSVGLGSDLVRPRSLVVDRSGIYFDPTRPSDLETLLANHAFSDAELERGRALIARLRTSRVTKYNTGNRAPLDLAAAGPRRRVLVPGQVEDDQSIQRGCVDVRTNRGLLEAARAAEPDAFLVYKPHPDVLVGNRAGELPPEAAGLADLVVTDRDMAACLAAVDGVHTLTSLTGFEALIHGRTVHTHGLPFYAGWGLTTDRHACPRRGRALPLEAVVLATLVLYPRYLDPASGLFTGPEPVIDALEALRTRSAAGSLQRLPRWRRWLLHLGHALRR